MHIIISNSSDKPIYKQISDSIKELILTGELIGEEVLPSIRNLAKDLKISVITTKRAYEELEKENFIEIIQGKGCYVKTKNSELLKEEILKKIEFELSKAINISNKYYISKEEVLEIFDYLYEEDIYEQ